MTQNLGAHWHFHCPECGLGDGELGHLLTASEIHCIVCLEEDDREVRLQRWLPDGDQARLRDDLAA